MPDSPKAELNKPFLLVALDHPDIIEAVAFSPDSKTLAAVGRPNDVYVWDVSKGKNPTLLRGHKDSIYTVSFSPDRKTLASGSWDKSVKLWDYTTGKLTATLRGTAAFEESVDKVHSLFFTPDGKRVIAGYDGKIAVWNVAQRNEMKVFERVSNRLALSPDGRTLVEVSDGSPVELMEIATGKTQSRFEGHVQFVQTAAFSPDGNIIATGGNNGDLKLWDVATGKVRATLKGHERNVTAVAFSPDSRTLASGSSFGSEAGDAGIRFWDVKTGAQLGDICIAEDVHSLAFSPDGKFLAASGDSDKKVRIWQIPEGKTKK